MQALGYISHSINDLLQPANTATVGYSGMGSPGDTYIVTDTRSRSVKDLDKLASLQKFDVHKLDAKGLEHLDENDPLLYENVKALINSPSTSIQYKISDIVEICRKKLGQKSLLFQKDPVELWNLHLNVADAKIFILLNYNDTADNGIGQSIDIDFSRVNNPAAFWSSNANELAKLSHLIRVEPLKWFISSFYPRFQDVIDYPFNFDAKYFKLQYLCDTNEGEWWNFGFLCSIDKDDFVSLLRDKIIELFSSSNSEHYDEILLLWDVILFILQGNVLEDGTSFINSTSDYSDITGESFSHNGFYAIKIPSEGLPLPQSNLGAPFGMSCLGNLCTGSDLGKPTIKFEFETNSELADFLKDTQKAAEFAETINPEGSAQPAADTAPNTNRRRNQKAIATDTPLSLMPGGMTPGLPPSPSSPKALPPSANAKALPDVVEPTPKPSAATAQYVPQNSFKIYGDFDVESIEPNMRPDDIITYFHRQYGYDPIVGMVSNVSTNPRYSQYAIEFYDYDAIDAAKILGTKAQDNFLLIPPTIASQALHQIQQQRPLILWAYRAPLKVVPAQSEASTPAALPTPKPTTPDVVVPTTPTEPEPSDVSAESVTDEEIETSNVTPVDIDWKAFEDAFAKASNWASMDPERSARVYVGGYKQYYDQYVSQVPQQYLNAFNWFVKRYVSDLISKRSRTASAAVTGPGGITAKKADSLNRANDRFMSASVEFPHALLKYINKIRLREKRNAFINSSIDDRYAQRISELKKEVNGLMYLKDTYEHIAKGGEIPEEVRRRYAWMSRAYGSSNLRESILKSLNYNLNLQKATFKDKLTREVSKGNVEIIDAIIDYLKPKGLFTNRAEIWQFPSFVRTRRESVERETQRVADAAADDNALYRVEYDEQEDRVKIYFNGMPSDKIRTWLKQNGFRWSPKNKAWQRQITENARRVVRMFEGLVQDGTLGKPTIKLEFENNGELLSLFDADTINGDKEPAAIFNCPESQLDCKGYRPTYKILPSYDHLIDPADGQSKLVGYGFEEATLSELIEACKYYRQVARLAQHLKASDALQTAFNIWHFLHTNVRYNYDAPGLEEIRVPARVWADRFTGVDCDCLAVFTACLLLNLGYRPQFEIVGFDNSPKYSHIYVTLDGYPIDRVLPSFLDRPKNITKTKIMDIPVYQLSGCTINGGLSGIYDSTLRRIATGTASAQDCLDFRKAQVLVSLQGYNPDAATLAEILMPYVGVVGDDGAYYFTNANVAKVATEADSELRQMQSQNLAGAPLAGWFDIVRQKVKAASEDVIINNPQCNAPTIVVIINPKREKVQVKGEMVKADLPTVNPLQSEPTLFTATLPESEAADEAPAEKKGSNVLWWALGVVGLTTAAVCMNEKKGKKK